MKGHFFGVHLNIGAFTAVFPVSVTVWSCLLLLIMRRKNILPISATEAIFQPRLLKLPIFWMRHRMGILMQKLLAEIRRRSLPETEQMAKQAVTPALLLRSAQRLSSLRPLLWQRSLLARKRIKNEMYAGFCGRL